MAEKEYIEREELINRLEDAKEKLMNNITMSSLMAVVVNDIYIDFIKESPAADVEPVRHGRWIYNPNGMDFNLGAWECSVCTQKNNNLPCSRNISPYICIGSKYCPNCGAKMDKTE